MNKNNHRILVEIPLNSKMITLEIKGIYFFVKKKNQSRFKTLPA